MKYPFIFRTLKVLFVCIVMNTVSAQQTNEGITLNLREANVSDAIRLVASFLNQSVVISPAVKGTVSLNYSHTSPQEAMSALLASQDLEKWEMGRVWLIAPREELVKRKQEVVKWSEVTDESAPLILNIWQLRYAKAKEVAELIQDERHSLVSKRGHIRVDTRTNKIFVQDLQQNMDEIHTIIQQIDVPVQQIAIDARLISVDSDYERELGVSFSTRSMGGENHKGKMLEAVQSTTGRFPLTIAKLSDNARLEMQLSALEQMGHAELLSNPSLFTTNQQEASIEAGEEVPYQEVSEGGGTATMFKKAVLSLKVTPQILPGNRVLLQLHINQDRPGNQWVQGVPTINTRQMMTSVLVKDEQTVVLGGIYETNNEQGQEGIPYLKDIPIVGWLFQQRHVRHSKRELLIFVTPRIM